MKFKVGDVVKIQNSHIIGLPNGEIGMINCISGGNCCYIEMEKSFNLGFVDNGKYTGKISHLVFTTSPKILLKKVSRKEYLLYKLKE